MYDFFAGFLIGMLIGSATGIFLISLAVAAKRGDDAFNVPPPPIKQAPERSEALNVERSELAAALDASAEPITDRSGQVIGVRIPEYLYVRLRAALARAVGPDDCKTWGRIADIAAEYARSESPIDRTRKTRDDRSANPH